MRSAPEGGRPPAGFTLIELLVALTIVAVVAGVAVPALAAHQSRAAVRHAADEFLSTLAMARAVAVRNGGVAETRIDTLTGRFWVEIDTTRARTGARDTVGPVTDVSADNVSLTSTESRVCYDPRGFGTALQGCPGTSVTVAFRRSGFADTVVVSALGKARR